MTPLAQVTTDTDPAAVASTAPQAVPEALIDAQWRLDAAGALAPGATILLLGVAAALVFYCYAREASPAGRLYRVLLGGLRMTTVALLLVMLSELLLSGTRSGRPRFAVLVDHSASMDLVDQGIEAELPGGVRAALANQNVSSEPKRRQIANAVLKAENPGLLRRLEEQFDVSVFAVADGVGAIGDEPAVDNHQADHANSSVVPAGATRLGDAIEQLLTSGGAVPPQGVLLLTDGQNTAGRDLAAAAEVARRSATPLYLIGIGADESPPDVAVTDLLADDAAYVDDLVSVRATLRWRGGVDTPVRVVLRRAGDSQVLAEQIIDPTSLPGNAAPIQLLMQPDRAGAMPLEIVAHFVGDATLDGERDPDNNTLRHTLTVHDGKLKVLLAAGTPHFEFRYVKHLLERDQSVELSTVLQEAGAGYASADPTALARFPVRRRELDAYDVIVLMDADPRLMPRSVWPALRAFVAQGGGGLALVAGPRSLPWAYRGLSDFVALSPFESSRGPIDGSLTEAGFQPTPTEQGLRTPALQLDDTAAASLRVWKTLPPLYWRADLGKAKPAAQVLATHPTARGVDGRPAPLIATQYFGAGRVLMHAFDATYRWRYRVGDAYFARYWVQSLRALARGKLQGSAATELTTDRSRYTPGDPVRLRLERRADAAGDDAPTELLLQSERGAEQRVALAPEPAARGVFGATLDDLPVGRYRVLLPGAGADRGPTATTFEIAAPPGETAQLERATDAMQRAAERSRGWYLPVEQADKAAERLPRGVRVPIETLPPIELWNRWWMLAAIVGCLSAEWILRKQRAML